MNKIFKVSCAITLSFSSLLPVLQIHAEDSLQSQLDTIKEEYSFTEEDFSYIYYNTVTGEYLADNPYTFMFAASLYKLPLNLYYYMLETNGTFSEDQYINGYVLSDAHALSIINSDNDASEAMIYGLGSFDAYRQTMFETFDQDHLDALLNLDSEHFLSNYYPSHLFFQTLKYLYENKDSYQQLLQYMSDPEQNNDVKLSFSTGTKVYQKQGWFENGTNNVTEIVETDEPYLLVIMINNAYGYSQDLLNKISELTYTYNTTHYTPNETIQSTQSPTVSSDEHPRLAASVLIGGTAVIVGVMILGTLIIIKSIKKH